MIRSASTGLAPILALLWLASALLPAPAVGQEDDEIFPIGVEPGAAEGAGDYPGLAESAPIDRVEPEDLAAFIDAGAALALDVRDPFEYLSGHLPGARSTPLAALADDAKTLPRDKLLVAYCSCPAEESSDEAVLQLRALGFTELAVLRGGYAEWVERGLPLATEGGSMGGEVAR